MATVAVDVDPRHWGSGERLAGRGGGHGSVNKTVRAWGEALGRREMDGRNGRIVSRGAPRRAPPARTIAHTALTLSPLAWLGARHSTVRLSIQHCLVASVSVCGSQCGAPVVHTAAGIKRVEKGAARAESVRGHTGYTALPPRARTHTQTQNAPLSPVRGSNPWHLD